MLIARALGVQIGVDARVLADTTLKLMAGAERSPARLVLVEIVEWLQPFANPAILPARRAVNDVLRILEAALRARDSNRSSGSTLLLHPILRNLHQMITVGRKALEHPPHSVGVHDACPANAGDVARFTS